MLPYYTCLESFPQVKTLDRLVFRHLSDVHCRLRLLRFSL